MRRGQLRESNNAWGLSAPNFSLAAMLTEHGPLLGRPQSPKRFHGRMAKAFELLSPPLKFLGRNAMKAFEGARKMIGIGEVKLIRHLLNEPSRFNEPLGCGRHSAMHQVFMWRTLGETLEESRKIGRIDITGRRRLSDSAEGASPAIDHVTAPPVSGESPRCPVSRAAR